MGFNELEEKALLNYFTWTMKRFRGISNVCAIYSLD